MIARLVASVLLFASVVCENGVCRLEPDETSAASAVQKADVAAAAASSLPQPDRIAQGVMSEDEFLAFLSGTPQTDRFAGKSLLLIVLLAVLGGLALNLTPCVLPMIPVNLIVIGASAKRGLLYGLGQFVTFGSLGLAAAIGGRAFGTIQSSPWFNLSVAILFVLLAVSLSGALPIDFTRFRRRGSTGAFFLGAVSALLAGACVAPVLVSVLLLSARLSAEGSVAGLALPFAVAFGLALPWPFLGAGLKVLPKPGRWMIWVNRLFALAVAGFAIYYFSLAIGGWRGPSASRADEMSPAAFARSGKLTEPRERPLLVFLHADWCKNCPAMARLMTDSPRVRAALGEMDVVRLKVERADELRTISGFESIKGLPAFVLYPPRM